MSRLWDKGERLSDRVLRFTAGEDHQLDARLVDYDVRASIAHARMLSDASLLSTTDFAAIEKGLTELADEHARGLWSIELADEDVHTALETRLTDRIGEAGGRVHLGRSRNDQVLVALRLYMRDAAESLADATTLVSDALKALADEQGDIALPGYTHMQQAMPSTVALWAEAYIAELGDDRAGLAAAQRRINKNPLGSAAGYGTPGIDIDRQATTDALQFSETHSPVTAVQLSRGKAEAGLIFEITQLQNDLARLAADLLLFYTQEFAYVSLPDSLTTGSSIMPQKRNPDVLELLRGAPASAIAALTEALTITAKLTSGYHRDLQRLKAPLFRSIDLCHDSLLIMSEMLAGVRFHADKIRLDPGLYSAEEANRLVVTEGIAFREAYRRIAKKFTDQ